MRRCFLDVGVCAGVVWEQRPRETIDYDGHSIPHRREGPQDRAAVIDIKRHRALWEDIEDGLISESRRNEKGVPLEKIKADLVKAGRVRE
jgi:hypothetical protein